MNPAADSRLADSASRTDPPISHVVVIGGGTAGWLAACMIAARCDRVSRDRIAVTLIESPDVATIGVGEGTWPTMRGTLAAIGLAEDFFLQRCDGAFKQGTRFDGWANGAPGDRYYHPFTPPAGKDREALALWQVADPPTSFAAAASPQVAVCERDLAPRQAAMPEYAGALNYGYHLDAGKFAQLLAEHGVEQLGMRHLRDHVVAIERDEQGCIAAVVTRGSGRVAGDLFLDCSGSAGLLIGEELGVGRVDCGDVLFNDRALAVQVPQQADAPLASQTNATAHGAGWLWDIGLPTRRGVGCVYSSRHSDDQQAERILRDYLALTAGAAAAQSAEPRLLRFQSAYLESFWVGNCIAIGQSAGFLEPLEASAIVMVELGVEALLNDFPRDRSAMPARARQFNSLMRYRWERIVEFLKLHYVLSRRDEPYWRDHRDGASVPARLAELLELWRDRPPLAADFSAVDEVFPAASWQYVLYGMGAAAPPTSPMAPVDPERLRQLAAQREQRQRSLLATLPSNRAYFGALGATVPRQKARAL